jgi:hypothetical protein
VLCSGRGEPIIVRLCHSGARKYEPEARVEARANEGCCLAFALPGGPSRHLANPHPCQKLNHLNWPRI